MSKVKLECLYDKTASSYGLDDMLRRVYVSGDNFRLAALKLLDAVNIFLKGIIQEKEEDLGRELTEDEVYDLIECVNGDGLQRIHFLKDTVSGKVFINCIIEEQEIT